MSSGAAAVRAYGLPPAQAATPEARLLNAKLPTQERATLPSEKVMDREYFAEAIAGSAVSEA